MEKFNVSTDFKSNTYYSFDNTDTNIYTSQAKPASEKKYFTICGTGLEACNQCLNTAFLLKDLENVTLDFGGAVITLHGKIQPFIIDSCKNITIKNVVVEYNRSHYTELDITGHVGNELHTKAKPDFPCRVENGYFIPYADEWEDKNIHEKGCIFMQAYDKISRDGAGLMVIYLGEEIVEQDSLPVDYVPHIKVRADGDEIIFIGDFPKNWNETKSIVLEHNGRTITSTAMYHSKNICFENYRILNGGGMGLYSVYTENITIKSFKLINDELSHGTVSNSADGLHLVATKGKIEITDSILEGTVDDTMNIHSNYYYTDKVKNNVLYARRSDKSHGLGAYADVFGIGDEIAVYSSDTLNEKQRFTVVNKEIIEEWVVKLTLDKNAVDICKNDLIENLSTNAQIVIKNTRFAKANSHLRFQTRGKTELENCEFSLPMLLTGDTNYWYESSPVEDMTIKNCRFTGERGIIRIIPEFTSTSTAPYYHKNIKIIDCTFDNEFCMEANYADNIIFENTKVSDGSKLNPTFTKCGRIKIN